MPIPRRDNESGAIIFDATPEEQDVKEIRETNAQLIKENKELTSRLDNIEKMLAQPQKGGKTK